MTTSRTPRRLRSPRQAALATIGSYALHVLAGATLLAATEWLTQARPEWAGGQRQALVELTIMPTPAEPEPELETLAIEVERVVVMPRAATFDQHRYREATAAEVEPRELSPVGELAWVEPSTTAPELVRSDTPPPAPTAAPLTPPRRVVERELAPPTVAATAPPTPFGQEADEAPDLSGNSPPRYPQLALARGWQGVVLLRIRLDATGRVTDVTVAQSSGYDLLDAAAVAAVRTWQGRPATRGGQPVATAELLPVRFRIP